jgi:hypothetical protein
MVTTTTPTQPRTERRQLLRNAIVSAITLIVVVLGITWQAVGTTTHGDDKQQPGTSSTHSTATGDETGKPGEAKTDQPNTSTSTVPSPTAEEGKTVDGDTNENTGKPGEQKP